MRNAAYDRGIFATHRLPVPVISVGNLSVGGTGKTPLVERLIQYYHGHFARVAVVTRGYGRSTRGLVIVSNGRGAVTEAHLGGDEPVQMARKFPSLVVVADEHRVRGCHIAIERFKPDLIILDDAYQHRACGRDVDIVVIDASRNVYEQRLMPAGRLREPLANLSRADVVVLSKCEPEVAFERLALSLRAYTSVPVVATRYIPVALRRAGDPVALPVDALRGRQVFSFCGIGSPRTFRRTMEHLGTESVGHVDFPDHHTFRDRDVLDLVRQARGMGMTDLLTTEKDAVRLTALLPMFEDIRIHYPEMQVEFLHDEHDFFTLVEERLRRRHHA
jgi:tetraacyldisaccharide 4'-kinase